MMTAQTELRPNTDISRKLAPPSRPRRVWWPILLFVAMVLAAVAGVAVAANVTAPTAPTRVSYVEPNANDREGRVGATATKEPNANDREGRVTLSTAEPNANDREGRASGNG